MFALQTLEAKNRILSKIREDVRDCERCDVLCATRNQTVFSDGNPNAKIMIIGEAPGADEDRQGIPFIGRAGKLLDNILDSCGWTRKDVYVTNILKCRPPSNRVPSKDEINNCIGYLDKQIAIVNPQYIICLGTTASQTLIGMNIGMAREKWHEYKGYKVLCTYHPAYLLRTPSAKELVWKDLEILVKDMEASI